MTTNISWACLMYWALSHLICDVSIGLFLVVGWMVVPGKRGSHPNLGNSWILPYLVKRVFVDEFKISRWDQLGLFIQALNPMESVLIRDRRGEDTERRGRKREKAMWRRRQRLELCSRKPGNAWSHQKLEEARKDFPLETSEGAWTYWRDFRVLACERRNSCCCSKPPSLWSFVMVVIGN